MRLLALPGRKPSTFQPLKALLSALPLDGLEVVVRPHDFWASGDVESPEISSDVGAVAGSAAQLVVAKSIGTLITMMAVRDLGFAPKACLFVGVPLRRLEALGLVSSMKRHCAAIPTACIQQTADFNGPCDDLKSALGGLARVYEVPGDDHAYEVIADIAPPAAAWLESARRMA